MAGKLSDIDWKPLVNKSIQGFFDTMLSMPMQEVDTSKLEAPTNERIVGSVSFAGEATGVVCIVVSTEFAKMITSTMLGMDPKEVEDGESVNDVIGEVSNMVGGNIKSNLCDAGFPCVLSIPSITRGRSFHIESTSDSRCINMAFQHKEPSSLVWVNIYVKAD